ncbi:hypothetical protein JCM17823_16470 [Halorubrum gandharaense]
MRQVLAYPVRGAGRLDAVLVVGGLHLLAVWVPLLPFVAVAGYLLRVFRGTAEAGRVRDTERPEWRPVKPLLMDGLRVIVVCAGYLVVPLVLLVVTLGGPLEQVDPTGTTDGLLFLVGSTVVMLLTLGAIYPLPAALVAVAREGTLRAAVDRRLIGSACRDGGYLFAVIVAWTLVALVAAVYTPLNAVALGFFLAAYVEVAAAAQVGAATGRAWERRGL